MLDRISTCLVLALAPQAAPTPRPDDLDVRFAAAQADAAQVVPLIVEASALIPQLDGDAGHALAERLQASCERAFFSPERLPGMEKLGLVLHRVEKGELPGAIARRYRVGAGLFRLLNAPYDERRIGAGRELKVLDLSDASLRLIVDRARHRLSAWRRTLDGAWVLVAYVPVGLGAPATPTPAGDTRVVQRERDPAWTDPVSRKVFAPGDPGNVLGGFWIELDSAGLGRSGIGIHGFTGADPAVWLGQDGSNGCIRLLTRDVERLFEVALEDTPVTIVP
jgi:lipoprotein-anchoring transpeptidase ErfK/SrfK